MNQKYQKYQEGYNDNLDSLSFYAIKSINLLEKVYLSTFIEEDKKFYSTYCGNTAWNFLLLNRPQEAIYCAKKGLFYDDSQMFIHKNLALGYLLNNEWDNALRVYSEMYPKQYQTENSVKNFKLAFLEDIDSLQKHSIVHKDFQKIKALLNNPKDFPKDLVEGLRLFGEADKLCNQGFEILNDSTAKKEMAMPPLNNFMIQIKAFIDKPYFNKYFNTDYYAIVTGITALNYYLQKNVYDVPMTSDAELLLETADELNRYTVNIHRYAPEKNYAVLVMFQQLSIKMTHECLKKTKDSAAVKQLNLNLVNYYGNLATYQLFANENAQALASVQEGYKYNNEDARLAVRLVLTLALNNNFITAKETYVKWKDKDVDIWLFDSFGERLLYEIEKLEKAGINNENLKRLKSIIE